MRLRSRRSFLRARVRVSGVAGLLTLVGFVSQGAEPPAAGAAQPSVLTVGTYKGITGEFTSIQAAVDAAKPGDWVLVGPGDYKTSTSSVPPGQPDMPAGVLITKPGLW